MSEPLAIVIAAKLPPAPYQLVDQTFMAALAVAEQRAAKLRVSDQASADEAGALQAELTKAGVALEKERLALLRPFLDAQNAINAAAKTASARIMLTKGAVNAQLVSWDTAQKKLADEAEKARQAEIKRQAEERQKQLNRLETLRKEEIAAADRKAAEMIRNQPPPPPPPTASIDLDDEDDGPIEPPPVEQTQTQKELTALRFAPIVAPPPVVAPKVAGLVFRSSLKIASINMTILPESFITMTPNETLLRATYVTGWKEGAPIPVCPGVVFEVVKTPVSR